MSLTVSGYMRQFYRGNLFGTTSNERDGQPAHTLFSADVNALRRAVRQLGDYDYNSEESDGEELVNEIQAFVSTYNNCIDSAKDMEDEDVNRYLSKLKKLTKGSQEELADIGIIVQNNGKLMVDEKALGSTGKYEVSKLFSSEAEYGTQVEKQMKRTYNMMVRNNLHIPKTVPKAANKTQTPANPPETGDQDAEGSTAPPAQEDIQLAQQLVQVLAGNHVDYSI